MIFLEDIKALIIDAIAFIMYPDARILSKHKYPSGNGMSIREAKRRGLKED